jgi:hypothetical protein
MTYEFEKPSVMAGADSALIVIAATGASAEALFAPNRLAMNAQRKHNTPKQGHLLRAFIPPSTVVLTFTSPNHARVTLLTLEG